MAENGKAKYYALMEEMKTDILSGKIRPGEKLPSENQLSVRYGLSRHTVRKALGLLAADGYIESFQGKGTFCADVLRQIHGTGNIAVVTTYISDYIFPRLIQGIDEVLSLDKNIWDLILVQCFVQAYMSAQQLTFAGFDDQSVNIFLQKLFQTSGFFLPAVCRIFQDNAVTTF